VSDPRSVDALESDLERAREDLARTTDELAARLSPRRQLADHAAPIVGVVAGVVVLVALRRWRRGRRGD